MIRFFMTINKMILFSLNQCSLQADKLQLKNNITKVDVFLLNLQHENLLSKKVVIRATNHLNLQRKNVARQLELHEKCCPHYWAFVIG